MARGTLERSRGLIGVREWRSPDGLLIPHCSSVHTWFMRVPIDVVYLDDEFEVVKVAPELKPWRLSLGGRGATQALELPAGEASRLGLTAGRKLEGGAGAAMSISRAGVAALAGGVLGGALAVATGHPPVASAVVALFLGVLAAVSVVDLEQRRIPNLYTYAGSALALVAAAAAGRETFAASGLGLLAGGGVMGALFLVGRGQLGLGDVKLAAFAGAVVGPQGALVTVGAGTVLGGVAALVLLLAGRDRHSSFAYGPFLAAGAVIAVLVGGPLVG